MKRLFIMLISAVLIFTACKKTGSTSAYMNIASITGPNLAVPICGAAYRITIHGVVDSTAQFDSLPAGSGISLSSATFPINVNINWHHNTGNECDTISNIITIDAIKKVD